MILWSAIILLGVLLRLAMLLSQKSLWGDEWFSIGLVQHRLADVWRGSVNDVHPPLYFLLLKLSVMLGGFNEISFRAVSFLAGVGTLFSCYALGKELFSEREGVLASGFAAISPYFIQSSNEIRSYSLLAFLSGATLCFFLKMVRTSGRRWAAAYVLSALGMIYAEHYGYFVLLATSVTLFCLSGPAKKSRVCLTAQTLLFLGCLPGAVFLLMPQAIFREHLLEAARVTEYWSWPILVKKFFGVYWQMASGYAFSMLTVDRILFYARHSFYFWFSLANAGIFFVAVGKGLIELSRRSRQTGILAIMVLFVPVVFLMGFYPIRLSARYLAFAEPLFLTMGAAGFLALGHRALRGCLAALFVLVSCVGAGGSILGKTDPLHKEDYVSQIRYVFQNAGKDDAISGLGVAVDYYQKRLGLSTEAKILPELSDLTGQSLREVYRVWVLDSANMHSEVENRNHRTISTILSSFGFVSSGPTQRFGGEDGLNVVYCYERKFDALLS